MEINLLSLPIYIINRIIRYLSRHDLSEFLLVCKDINDMKDDLVVSFPIELSKINFNEKNPQFITGLISDNSKDMYSSIDIFNILLDYQFQNLIIKCDIFDLSENLSIPSCIRTLKIDTIILKKTKSFNTNVYQKFKHVEIKCVKIFDSIKLPNHITFICKKAFDDSAIIETYLISGFMNLYSDGSKYYMTNSTMADMRKITRKEIMSEYQIYS